MQSVIVVRSSTIDDDHTINALAQSAHADSLQYRGRPQFAPASHHVVALVGESIVGALGYESSSTEARITWVHVFPVAREIGVADALVSHALQLFTASHIPWVSATAQPGDRQLKNLFERHGLVAQQIVVGKSLSDPSTEEHASQ